MTNRKAIFRDGWDRASRLHAQLSDGGEIPTAPPTTVRLAPDERTLLDTELGFERNVGRTITAPLRAERKRSWAFGGGLAGMAVKSIHNRRVRTRNAEWNKWADEQSAPQWRSFGTTRTILTDQRLLCDHHGWTIFHLAGVVELRPAPRSWSLELHFNDTAPLRLVGAFAPWCSVVLASLLYGPQGLEIPGFEALKNQFDSMPSLPPSTPS